MSGSSVSARAPAKVNVHLGVGPLRPDGFHELATVFLAVSLFDTVTVRPGDGLTLQVSGEGTMSGEGTRAAVGVSSVPDDRRNIVWQAAELLAASAGVPADADIDVAKAIPVAAGLAGGSADAAAALVALDALWGTRAARSDLVELAAQLGSDVPFALLGGVALGGGRGERLTPALTHGRSHWVLGIAGVGLSTPAVYAELDRLRASGRVSGGAGLESPDAVLTALRGGGAGLADVLANDLQEPATSLRPDLRRALTAATEAGAAGALVSGSGPTVAALVQSEEAAVRLAARLAGEGIFRTVRTAHGPVPGARLVS